MESNMWYVKLVSIELLCMFFNMIQLGNSMVIYEVSYEDQFLKKKTRHIFIALLISTINAFALGAALVFRNWIEYKWSKSKRLINPGDGLWETGYAKLMVIEGIIALQAPHVFLQGFEYKEFNSDYDVNYTYPINHLMTLLTWSKFYIPIRTRFLTNKYTAPRAQRVCALYGTVADKLFSLRSEFKERPNTTLLGTFLLSGAVLAYMLRICERPLSEASG